MRQPPRQPPRQQPKPAARRAAPKAAPKAGPKAGPKPNAKASQTRARQASNHRVAQHARDAQRANQRQQGGGKQQGGGPQRGTRGVAGRPLRGWRSWWATHEMDRRQRGRRVAHSQVGGGFTILRNWGAGRVTAILTLLLLALFTGAIALGAQSFVAAIVAFLFIGGALAIATAMQARNFYTSSPPDTGPPLENIADLRIDDIKIDEEDDSEVNSVDALRRSFDKGDDPDEPHEAATATPEATASSEEEPSPEPETPAPKSEDESSASTPDNTDPGSTADTPTKDAPADEDTGTASADVQEPAEDVTPASAQQATQAPATPNRVFVAEAAETTAASDSPADSNSGVTPVIPQQRDGPGQEPDPADSQASAPAPTHPVAPEEESGVETSSSDEDTNSDTGGTALHLLTAETPGTDLLAAYTSSNTSVPPETVRDVAATLIVSNLDRSIMFYTELLGLVEIDRAPDAVLLEAGFGRVLLWRRDDAPGAGDPVMHLTFEVGDIDRAYRSLSAKGVRFTHPPVSALSGEVHDLRAASFLDPDGHGLAITQLREH